VGGQVAELLVTNPAAVRIRATEDMDVIVKVATRTEYHRFGERLRALGFREDSSPGAPLCRWRDPDDLPLDVMPLDAAILGFTNRWYEEALRSATRSALVPGLYLRIPSAPAFLATKWAAFDGRGGGVYLGNADVEDIVTVVAGRAELTAETAAAPAVLRAWLAGRTAEFLRRDEAADVSPGRCRMRGPRLTWRPRFGGASRRSRGANRDQWRKWPGAGPTRPDVSIPPARFA